MRNQRAMSQTHFLPSCELEASFKQKLSKEDCLPNYRLEVWTCYAQSGGNHSMLGGLPYTNSIDLHRTYIECVANVAQLFGLCPSICWGKCWRKKTAQEYAVGPVSNSNLHNVRTFNHTTPRRLDVLGDRTGVPFLFELFGGLREFPWVLSLRFVCETVFMLG